MTSKDAGWRAVQHALRHLYDPDALRLNPLASQVSPGAEGDCARALRQLLCETIRAMRPENGIPAGTRPWRDYQILYHRYVRGCTQLEVATQVGLSVRQLRREEHRAIEALARRLDALHEFKELETGPRQPSEPEDPIVASELAWLAKSDADETTDLGAVVAAALELIAPMASQRDVDIQLSAAEVIRPITANAVVARQALLVLLAVALRHTHTGAVLVSVCDQEYHAEVTVAAPQAHAGLAPLSPEDRESLALASRLLAPFGGQVAHRHNGILDFIVSLPTVEQTPVMVIEDNVDTVRLVQRYLAGSRYRVCDAPGLDQALEMVEHVRPRAIILDVVMPNIDGWEVLQRLGQHPSTEGLPVLVCTILPEQELAFSLGAEAYLHKPFTRDELRRALDRLVGQEA